MKHMISTTCTGAASIFAVCLTASAQVPPVDDVADALEQRRAEILTLPACKGKNRTFILTQDTQRVQIVGPNSGVKGVDIYNNGGSLISAQFERDGEEWYDHEVPKGNEGYWPIESERVWVASRGGGTVDAVGCYRLVR